MQTNAAAQDGAGQQTRIVRAKMANSSARWDMIECSWRRHRLSAKRR